MSQKRTIIKHILQLTTSGYSANVLLFLRAIINAKFMGPTNYGIWRSANLFLNYTSHAHFGVMNGLILEVPVCYGKGDQERVKDIRNTAFTFVLMVMALIFFISFFSANFFEDQLISTVVQIMSFMVLLNFIKVFYVTLLNIDLKFEFLSKLMLLTALLNVTLTYFLVKRFNIFGALATNIILLILSILYIRRNSRYALSFSLDFDILKYLLKIGLPILLPVLLKEVMETADKIIIIKYLGQTVFGYYSITMMAGMVVLFMPSVLISTIQPRLYKQYGKEATVDSVKQYLFKPLYASTYLLPVLIGVVYILFPLLVEYFLKDYIAGIPALKIILMGLAFYTITYLPVSLLNLLKQQNKLLIIFLIGIALNVALNYSVILLGMGIQGIAMATTLMYTLLTASITGFALRYYFTRFNKILLRMTEFFLPALILFSGLYFIDFGPFSERIQSHCLTALLLKTAWISFLTIPFAYCCHLRTGVFNNLGGSRPRIN